MSKNSWPVVLSLLIGLFAGLLLNRFPVSLTAVAQNTQSNQILVHGNGRAASRLAPPGEQMSLISSYQAQLSVHQPMTVNIGNANVPAGKHDILFQVTVEPMKSDQVHLCSGYVIPAGNSLVAWTGFGPEPEQYVSISVTGYLVDQ